jgi:ABC-type phosphate/phosphonate transport system substrate-binding protein
MNIQNFITTRLKILPLNFLSVIFLLLATSTHSFSAQSEGINPVATDPPYKMGIVPFANPERLEEIFAPAAAEMGNSINHPVEFKTTQSVSKYYDALKAGEYDIALVHAFFYVTAVDNYKYKPLVRMIEPFTAAFVVLENSTINSLADLKGKTIATPPEFLPTVHLIRKYMRQNGYNPARDFSMKAFKGIDSCLQQVVIGEAAACVSPPFALRAFEAKMNIRFRSLMETPSIPNLKKLITSWSNSDAGRLLIKPMQTRAFVPVQDSEFDQVRNLIKNLEEPWLPSTL